jgi:hypothetical protein
MPTDTQLSRFIPVSARRFGQQQVMRIERPAAPPAYLDVQHSSRISNNHYVPWRVLFDRDTIVFELETVGQDVVDFYIRLDDDAGNGAIPGAEITIRVEGAQVNYVQFSGFPRRADGSPMRSCESIVSMSNVAHPSQGVSAYKKIYV